MHLRPQLFSSLKRGLSVLRKRRPPQAWSRFPPRFPSGFLTCVPIASPRLTGSAKAELNREGGVVRGEEDEKVSWVGGGGSTGACPGGVARPCIMHAVSSRTNRCSSAVCWTAAMLTPRRTVGCLSLHPPPHPSPGARLRGEPGSPEQRCGTNVDAAEGGIRQRS